ncbi:MAG: NAD-dependent epimerase/dehydratase family protein [Verrucomicrobiota bacterium JB022]|nr:NAD-dependent epimerase/dehydratase family protein [Verrucomicrobiota bacterium JB022]
MESKENPQLVIFGCGYVGGAVAREALRRGWRVTALTRNPEKAAQLQALGCRTVVADLASDDWHQEIPGPVDYVLNAVSGGGGGIEGYRRSYLEGQQSVLAWAKNRQVGALVYTSSTSVYPQTGGEVVTEDDATDGDSEMASVLLQAEGLLQPVPDGVERAYVLRLAGIYGPGRHYLLDRLREGHREFPGTGDFFLNLIHLDDIVAGIFACFAAPVGASGVYNLADDAPQTKAEVVHWIAQRLGIEDVRFNPELDGPRQARRRRMGRTTSPHRQVSAAKAKAALDWAPRYGDFRAGYEAIFAAE